MINKESIKGVIFDYGGTIDTNGIHWGEVLWTYYQQAGVPVDKDAFDKAYVHGERTLGRNPIIRPEHNFHDLLLIKVQIQLNELIRLGQLEASAPIATYNETVASECYAFAQRTIAEAKPVLQQMARTYPLVLVSNFYGNIQAVLDDFGIGEYFKAIVESAVVGVRKPDPSIFTLGVQALGLQAAETVVVGDSYSKDIEPGKLAGCNTIWLNVCGWGDDKSQTTSSADETISSFNILKGIL